MAACNRSGSLFFKCRTQTNHFNYGLGSVFLSASLAFSVAFCCDTVYWAFLFSRMGLPACFTDPPARHEPASVTPPGTGLWSAAASALH